MNPLPSPPLLVITDRRQAARPLAEIILAACEAGCRWFSLREKDLSAEEQVRLARELAGVARPFGASVMLHGSPELAAQAGLDGVHLGAGADAAAARRVLGAGALIGQSVHNVSDALSADAGVLDYLIAGPAFLTASKPGYGPALGIERVRAIAAATRLPVVAVGGVTPESLPLPCAAVAVMGGVMRAPDVAAKVRALLRR